MIVSFNLLTIRQNKTVVGAYHIDINSKTWLSVVRPCEKSKTYKNQVPDSEQEHPTLSSIYQISIKRNN